MPRAIQSLIGHVLHLKSDLRDRIRTTATLRYIGGNSYQGNFYNSEYDVSGTINVAVGGNRQVVRLSSGARSATFELRR